MDAPVGAPPGIFSFGLASSWRKASDLGILAPGGILLPPDKGVFLRRSIHIQFFIVRF